MKSKASDDSDELRPNYRREDFPAGSLQRGRYAAAGDTSRVVVVLDAENAAAFPDDKAVNNALHLLLAAAKTAVHG